MEITNVIGETRQVEKVYEDGSYNCPFCTYAVRPTDNGCANPQCESRPEWRPEQLLARKAEREARLQEQKEREDRARWNMEYQVERAERERAFRMEQYQKAKDGGYCLNCVIDKYDRVKFIKHRKECPNA